MGSKDAARARMIDAGVPVVPGADGAAVRANAHAAAEATGFPLLVKAAAGGGGKGMRVVREAAGLDDALDGVRREAAASFGDDTVLLERWVEHARHVEVQVFADAHGHGTHLFDRDCSTQRRHQKVIEEAPAPDVPEAVRARMAEAAVAAARAVDYVGAGTVEFLLAGEEFFFLEMNTRLQVEHPVTELVTGEDLVEWQLRVAAGEPLPERIDAPDGHAIEVRLYAEDPAAGFLPAIGTLDVLRLPDDSPGARVDAGVRPGDVVSPHYDPMIAKIAVHGADRDQALDRLATALAETRVHGVRTNLGLLRALVADASVRAAPVHTTWLEGEVDRLLPPVVPTDDDLAVAAVGVALAREAIADEIAEPDPFATLSGFRLNRPVGQRVTLAHGESIRSLVVEGRGADRVVRDGEGETRVRARLDADDLTVALGGETRRVVLVHDADAARPEIVLLGADRDLAFELRDELAPALHRDENAPGSLLAPMPGAVVAVNVAEGDAVDAGAALLVIEAMKMEHTVRAPHSGTVRAVHYAVGDRVDDGAVLVEVEEA
jgi:3-methylcrotonyl-CoA carboxylase alpha subunit